MESDDDEEALEPDRYRPFDYVIDGDDEPARIVEQFNSYFQANYHASPAFFCGTLEEALNEAFQTKSMADRRPLLVYLHCEETPFTPLFCAEIFSKERLIDYLLDNYLVWPWDITANENRAKFAAMWNDCFPAFNFADLRVEECPMLIGVMQRSPQEKQRLSPFDYETRVLLRHDPLELTGQQSTLQEILQMLRAFSDEWSRNEELLIFDFSDATKLCPDVLVEISRYLTLEETITAFSLRILPLLRQAHNKVHLLDPSHPFLQIIPRHLDASQISSIGLHGVLVETRHNYSAFHAFNQLVSLTLINPQRLHALPQLAMGFVLLRSVSLCFEDEFQFHYFQDALNLSFIRFTRLQVRCAGAIGNPYVSYGTSLRYMNNWTIESFIFDSGHYPLHSNMWCSTNPRSCFLQSAGEFIRSLFSVRRVRFITDRHQIQTFLQIEQWQKIISQCTRLNRVIIQLLGDGDFHRQAEDIEQELRQRRPGLIFRIKSV